MHPRSDLNHNHLSLGLQFIFYFLCYHMDIRLILKHLEMATFNNSKDIVLSISEAATKVNDIIYS